MTASRGEVRNGPYYSRAKEYTWQTMQDCFPRNVTPTDMDGLVELRRCYWAFEGKTKGRKIDMGQWLALNRLIMDLPRNHAVLVVATHQPLDKVNPRLDIDAVQYGYNDGGKELVFAPPMRERSALWHICKFFADDAERDGFLSAPLWHGKWEAMGRPFVEGES